MTHAYAILLLHNTRVHRAKAETRMSPMNIIIETTDRNHVKRDTAH
jgi:hypothetical protein